MHKQLLCPVSRSTTHELDLFLLPSPLLRRPLSLNSPVAAGFRRGSRAVYTLYPIRLRLFCLTEKTFLHSGRILLVLLFFFSLPLYKFILTFFNPSILNTTQMLTNHSYSTVCLELTLVRLTYIPILSLHDAVICD